MKIGIVTINDYNNLGNRLQNYALHQVLKKLNVKPQTLYFFKYKKFFKECVKIFFPINNKFKKIHKGYKFTRKYMKTNFVHNTKNIKNKFDYFICGSDQVWNYNFKAFDTKMFLDFAPKEKNIAYSASIGVSEISNDYKEMFEKGLSNFKDISVREPEAKTAIESLNKSLNAKVVLDPTLLIDKDDWLSITKKPVFQLPERYILTYVLGNKSDEFHNTINSIAKKEDCEIIDITDKKSKYYAIGPDEFLYLEANAHLICTDSFHATVFAIIFNVPFLVFERKEKKKSHDMNSRIYSLLNLVNMKQQLVQSNKNIDYRNINFENANKIIDAEKIKSIEYLRKNIK